MNIRIITFLRKEGNIGQALQLYAMQKTIYNIFYEKAIAYDISTIENFHKINVDFNIYKLIYSKKINTLEEIYNDDVDYFILGSDQIFNPYANKYCKEFYLLDNIPIDKKIPYAVSFYKNCCHNIKTKTISFREEVTQDFLNDINYSALNTTINQHIDPVFLLEKSDIVKLENYNNSNVLLCNDNSNNIFYNQTNNDKDLSGYIWELNNLNGYCFITSYHLFVLSIIFNKKMIFINNIHVTDRRFISLIKLLNIKFENNQIINYDEVLENIKIQKNKAIEYLKENII